MEDSPSQTYELCIEAFPIQMESPPNAALMNSRGTDTLALPRLLTQIQTRARVCVDSAQALASQVSSS